MDKAEKGEQLLNLN